MRSSSGSSATACPHRAADEINMPAIGSCAATCGLMSGERFSSRQQSMSIARVLPGVFSAAISSDSLMEHALTASTPKSKPLRLGAARICVPS
eukprot:6644444-Prymnesium_polylepis.1